MFSHVFSLLKDEKALCGGLTSKTSRLHFLIQLCLLGIYVFLCTRYTWICLLQIMISRKILHTLTPLECNYDFYLSLFQLSSQHRFWRQNLHLLTPLERICVLRKKMYRFFQSFKIQTQLNELTSYMNKTASRTKRHYKTVIIAAGHIQTHII